MLGAEVHPGMNCQLRVITGSATGGEGSMSAVLETSDGHVDSVSVLVDPF